ncbi:hypothetical protein KJ966_24255 [bacterium]|nr:hypothetical protein [bacterium]
MKPESALARILENSSSVFQFYIELNVSVYDPEEFASLEEEVDLNLIPYEISEKSYKQKICFVRDEFLSIETVDLNGKALHIYMLEIGGNKFSTNLSDQREFSDEDVLFPTIMLYTKHLSLFKKSIYRYSIIPASLEISSQNDLVFYKIGSGNSFMKVDPDSFHIFELLYQVQIRGRYFPLVVSFLDWDLQRKVIPETTRFYIKSRLYKETRISSIQYSGIYSKRNSVLQKYKDLLPSRFPFSVSLNYGN